MREILFRGKRTDDGEWVYGYYGVKGLDTDLEKHYVIQETLNTATRDNFFYFTDIEVVTKTVGQYTGLKDKNGKKIFEGDITNHHSHKTTVAWQWSENYNQICGVEVDGTHRFYFSIDSVSLELIGNIHDNPELLTEELK